MALLLLVVSQCLHRVLATNLLEGPMLTALPSPAPTDRLIRALTVGPLLLAMV